MSFADIVLLVEDDINDFTLLQRALQKVKAPYDLKHVDDGQKAIHYLEGAAPFSDRQASPLPSLVILDLKLPLKNGFEVLQWVRQHPELRALPIIIMTSSEHTEDVRKAYQLGANSYLVKPSSPSDLAEMASCLVRYWGLNKFPNNPQASWLH